MSRGLGWVQRAVLDAIRDHARDKESEEEPSAPGPEPTLSTETDSLAFDEWRDVYDEWWRDVYDEWRRRQEAWAEWHSYRLERQAPDGRLGMYLEDLIKVIRADYSSITRAVRRLRDIGAVEVFRVRDSYYSVVHLVVLSISRDQSPEPTLPTGPGPRDSSPSEAPRALPQLP